MKDRMIFLLMASVKALQLQETTHRFDGTKGGCTPVVTTKIAKGRSVEQKRALVDSGTQSLVSTIGVKSIG